MLQKYLSLVKFSHTIFALPFALVGGMIGFSETLRFDWYKLLFILICMVTARSAAMGFNRLVDRKFDELNGRTKIREIPAGQISPQSATWFVILNCLIFVLSTWAINFTCFLLAPVALFTVLFYSYTKRFTWLCHIVLGAGLGLAPVGSYLAVTDHFSLPIVILGFVVLTWVAGFDIVYALQDEEFDKNQKLYSIPVRFGRLNAIRFSEVLHFFCFVLLLTFGWMIQAGWLFWIASGAFTLLLILQHRLVKPNDLSKINLAFFTTNGIGSLVFGTLVITDYYLRYFLK